MKNRYCLNPAFGFLFRKKGCLRIFYPSNVPIRLCSANCWCTNKNRHQHQHQLKPYVLFLPTSPWEEKIIISENYNLTKQQKFFSEITAESIFNLIYFDAFGIRVQPELWTEEIFMKMHNALKPNGFLVTYAANGNARRAMQAVGFSVERLPGPPGKKEMLRGTKLPNPSKPNVENH